MTLWTTLAKIFCRPMPALLVFDTNVVMDIWLGRDGDEAALLLSLAEQNRIALTIPEFVLIEFQGTARRWVREQRASLRENVQTNAKAWARSSKLDEGADDLFAGAKKIDTALDELERNIKPLSARLDKIARIEPHSQDLHFRGDLRFLRGDPPDRPRDGLQDCRIFEVVLAILRADSGVERPARIFVTKDKDFSRYEPVVSELAAVGGTLRADLGKLYGELR